MASALVACRICQKEISRGAKLCPHCGDKRKGGLLSKIMVVLLGGVTILITVALLNSGSGNAKSNTAKVDSGKVSGEPSWNTNDPDGLTNGNIMVAARLIKSNTIPEPVKKTPAESADEVIKAPWRYYGQTLCFEGLVAVVQDYPPGNNIAKAFGGGEASEVVMTHADGTIVDFILAGSSVGVRTGEMITRCGMPVGRIEAPNTLGGKFTHLSLVGKQ